MENAVKTKEQLVREMEELRQRNAELYETNVRCEIKREVLEESEMKFRAVARSALDAIVSADSNEKIIFWNRGASRIFGYSEEEALGKPLTILMPERYREAHSEAVRRFLTTGQSTHVGVTLPLRGMRKGGEEFPIELSLSSWTESGNVFFTGIIRDISDRVEAERIVEQRSEEARRRREEMESLLQMVAHDLKSPVMTIAGLVRVLRGGSGKASHQARTEQILEQLAASSQAMEAFLKDLLDGLAPDQSEPQRMPVHLEETISDVVRDYSQVSEEKGIEIQVDIAPSNPVVIGDRHRISQVVSNLLGNAIRYMGTNPHPLVTIHVHEEHDMIVTRLSDNGIGIPAHFQTRIFDRFFRVPSSGRQEGTGLGLSIVKKIVESLGGRIWVESEEGKGTTFSFTLPKCAAADSPQ
jgi:PAS domain S-box-containing protein